MFKRIQEKTFLADLELAVISVSAMYQNNSAWQWGLDDS